MMTGKRYKKKGKIIEEMNGDKNEMHRIIWNQVLSLNLYINVF